MKTMGLSAASLAVPHRLSTDETSEKKPNVIVIVTDDQGWGDIHSHGNDLIDTPMMDRLAAAGARLDRFYVSPVCAPTRASLLTGRYHPRTGVSGVARGFETMRSDEVTIADILRRAGYATGCFGKWHNGAHYPYHPNGRGFEEFLGFCCGHWNNYFDTMLEHNGEPVRTKGYINDVLTDAALAFIEKNRGRPFFCYIPYNTPHTPFQVPDRYFDKYKARGLDDALASAYGMCENLDDNLGRLLAKLDTLDLAEDTIIIMFGDNGPNTDRYNGAMRGRKGSVYEGGVRNFLFFRYPKRVEPNTVVQPITADIDLLPTLVELTGVKMPKTLPLDGVSIVPLLQGETETWPDRMIFSYWNRKGAVRTERHRLVVQRKRAELYDMAADPGEQNDIAQERPDVTKKLKAAYDEWLEDVTRRGSERPPIPVGYAQMKRVEMTVPEATWHGGLKFGGRHANNNWVTNWVSTDAHLYWDIDVVHAGPYEMTLMYICPEEDVGARVCVEVDGERVEGVIEKAHDLDPVPSPDRVPRSEVYERIWAPLTLGRLTLREGRTRLYVKALTKPGKAVMDLKAVRVRRLD
jgi:arylsulfatase A